MLVTPDTPKEKKAKAPKVKGAQPAKAKGEFKAPTLSAPEIGGPSPQSVGFILSAGFAAGTVALLKDFVLATASRDSRAIGAGNETDLKVGLES